MTPAVTPNRGYNKIKLYIYIYIYIYISQIPNTSWQHPFPPLGGGGCSFVLLLFPPLPLPWPFLFCWLPRLDRRKKIQGKGGKGRERKNRERGGKETERRQKKRNGQKNQFAFAFEEIFFILKWLDDLAPPQFIFLFGCPSFPIGFVNPPSRF